MRFLVAGLAALICAGSAGAVEWQFVARVTPPTLDHALICHLWNAKVFAPGEKFKCGIGTVLAANLTTGEIGYAMAGYPGMPAKRDDIELDVSVIPRALEGEATVKLNALYEQRLKSQEAAIAERTRREYLENF
jgi:hypothetical protein